MKGLIDMKKSRINEFEKLDMLRALIGVRIDYYENKQGDKTFNQDIIDELKGINTVVCTGLNSFLREAIEEKFSEE